MPRPARKNLKYPFEQGERRVVADMVGTGILLPSCAADRCALPKCSSSSPSENSNRKNMVFTRSSWLIASTPPSRHRRRSRSPSNPSEGGVQFSPRVPLADLFLHLFRLNVVDILRAAYVSTARLQHAHGLHRGIVRRAYFVAAPDPRTEWHRVLTDQSPPDSRTVFPGKRADFRDHDDFCG